MLEFFTGLSSNLFLQHAMLAVLLSSVACGMVGSFVVVRRISYIAGGIAHCVLGGIGAALYLQHLGCEWAHPLVGATVAALLAAVIIGLLSLSFDERVDTVIGAVWAIGMALGVLFISLTPGYAQNMMSYLFGNILFVTRTDLILLLVLDLVILIGGVLFYPQFVAICFDSEFAKLRGVHVGRFYLLLLCLTALTVVLLTAVVGIVLVIALLTLPAATAGQMTKRLWQMMALAILLCAVASVSGLALAYSPELPPGASIVLMAGLLYLVVIVGKAMLARFVR